MAAERASTEQFLTPADVAARVFVDPKTVSRWARAGKIPSQRTPGGHRRFRSSDVDVLVSEGRLRTALEEEVLPPVLDDGTINRLLAAGDLAGEMTAVECMPAHRDAGPNAADAQATEANAVALEVEAGVAAQALLEAVASIAVAVETATAASLKARQARAFAAAEITQMYTNQLAGSTVAMRGCTAGPTACVAQAAARARGQVASTSNDARAALDSFRSVTTEQAATVPASADSFLAAALAGHVVDDAVAHLAALVAAFDLAVEQEIAAAGNALQDVMLRTGRDAARELRRTR